MRYIRNRDIYFYKGYFYSPVSLCINLIMVFLSLKVVFFVFGTCFGHKSCCLFAPVFLLLVYLIQCTRRGKHILYVTNILFKQTVFATTKISIFAHFFCQIQHFITRFRVLLRALENNYDRRTMVR